MSENVLDQVLPRLRDDATRLYPDHGECKSVRLVGHTPKTDHFIYDAVLEFANASERIYCKVYSGRTDASARSLAQIEYNNLSEIYKTFVKRRLSGVPRPLGDFTDLGAIVAERNAGLPLQSIIMKAALLPGYADGITLSIAARHTGEWLRNFHRATADGSIALDSKALLEELEKVCVQCKSEGLTDTDIQHILNGARMALAKSRKALSASAVLHEFNPLNIATTDHGIIFSDFSRMSTRGNSLEDVAEFMAFVEALEKYPFCNREITASVQESFLQAYGISLQERSIVRVLKIRALLRMFAAGRNIKDTAVRKKVMWANVMKRFINQSANRTLSNAA